MTDDLMALFTASSDEEKIENFALSTLKLVLGQLGASAKQVRWLANEHGEGFDFDWFNGAGYISPTVLATRCFNFNLAQLFTAPHRSPLTEHWREVFNPRAEGDLCVVFKAHDLGRMMLTTLKCEDRPHIGVRTSDTAFNVVLFKDFFKSRYGNVLGEVLDGE